MTSQFLFRLDPLTTISLAADTIFGAYVAATVYAGGVIGITDIELIGQKKWGFGPAPSDIPEAERLRAAQRRWRERNPGWRNKRKEARKAEAEMAAS